VLALLIGLPVCAAAGQQRPATSPANQQQAFVVQDSLLQARALYASALYDEALAMLDRLSRTPGPETAAIAEYRVFCLLALERQDDANRAIEALLRQNPSYRPSDGQMSPRIQSVIIDVRRRILPTIVLSAYADAKASFDNKNPIAAEQFDRVLALLDDPDVRTVGSLNDLRTVVVGFRDLSRARVEPSPAEPAAQTSTPPVTRIEPPPAPVVAQGAPTTPAPASPPPVSGSGGPSPDPPGWLVPNKLAGAPPSSAAAGTASGTSPSRSVFDASDRDVVGPVAIRQKLPPWNPQRAEGKTDFKGALLIIVDDRGNVGVAVMQATAHPSYDAELVQLARTWKFKPATRNGVPVAYQMTIDVALRPSGK
jgi:protein TonB